LISVIKNVQPPKMEGLDALVAVSISVSMLIIYVDLIKVLISA